MEKINILLSLLLFFTGISAFDIKAASKHSDEPAKTERKESNELLFKVVNEIINETDIDKILTLDINKIKDVLNKGADVNARDSEGYTALMRAANKGYIGIVKLLLENGADVNAKDPDGNTVLINASNDGNSHLVQLLIKSNADVNAVNKNGDTALILIATKQLEYLNEDMSPYRSIVQMLLDHGADVSIKNNSGYTASDKIAGSQGTEIRKKLIYDAQAVGPLVRAVKSGNKALAEQIIKEGKVDINLIDSSGRTALIWAAVNNHPKIVELLLKNGANANAKDNQNVTSLMKASENGNIDIVRLLLEHNADVNIQDIWKRTALKLATDSGHNDIVKLLLKYADISIEDLENKTYFSHLDSTMHPDLENLEKIYNEHLEYIYKTIDELFISAQKNNFKRIKEILIKSPHLINKKDKQKETLLNNAILFGRLDLIKQLFENPEIRIKPDLLTDDIFSETNPVNYAETLGRPSTDSRKQIYRDISEYLRKQRDIQEAKKSEIKSETKSDQPLKRGIKK